LSGGPDLIVSGRCYCCCRAGARSAAVRQDRCAGAGGPDHPAWPLYSGVVSVFVTGDAVLVADGGLVTELEVRGNDLSDSLWSARLLMDAPEEILDAPLPSSGRAQIATSASYQASFEGFARRKLGRREAAGLPPAR
jgi:Homocysteine S-methyltransferase